MSYFIATTKDGRDPRAVNRWLYPTKKEAQEEADWLAWRYKTPGLGFVVMDADHYPGKGILKNRHGFA